MSFVEKLVSLIAPHTCLLCGSEGSLLCSWCEPDALEPLPPRCFMCYSYSEESKTCKACRKGSRPGHVWVASDYSGIAKELVHRLKFSRTGAAAEPIARALDAATPHLEGIVVTHIPTATSRRRQRGYDQAELIAARFATERKLQHETLLYRRGQQRQVGADKKQRKAQMQEALVAKPGVNAETVLLIDDLVTTGATLSAAKKTLREAGVKNVFATVFAQKQ